MRKSIFIPLVAISVLTGCNDQDAQNKAKNQDQAAKTSQQAQPLWVGKYQGTTPCMACVSRCEDCPGMSVDLTLKADQTFVLNRISLSGHNDIEILKGKFDFLNNDSKMVELKGLDKRNLILVDLEHQVLEIREDITGNGFVAYDDFSLTKVGQHKSS